MDRSVALSDPRPHSVADVPALVRATHDLLASKVPLTLLLDLAEDGGPHSQERYASEGGDASWLSGAR